IPSGPPEKGTGSGRVHQIPENIKSREVPVPIFWAGFLEARLALNLWLPDSDRTRWTSPFMGIPARSDCPAVFVGAVFFDDYIGEGTPRGHQIDDPFRNFASRMLRDDHAFSVLAHAHGSKLGGASHGAPFWPGSSPAEDYSGRTPGR